MVRNLGELGINLQKIISRLGENQNLLKLLYYTEPDPLGQPDITSQVYKDEIFDKLIKIVPRVTDQDTAKSIVALRVLQGNKSLENDQFRDISLSFEVFVPMTQWKIKDSNLRPFAILGEIEKSLNHKKVNGLGRIEGGDFQLSFLTEEVSCYAVDYSIVEYE